MKISDDGAGEEYGIEELPSLVYFENGVPEIFEGKTFCEKHEMNYFSLTHSCKWIFTLCY